MSDLRRIAITSLVTLAPLWGQPDTRATGMGAQEHRLTSNLELHDVSIAQAALSVLKSFRQPGGIVTTPSGECAANERKSFFLPWGLDLKGALDIIAPHGSSLLWTSEGLVVNMLPREKIPDLMNARLPSFQWNTRDHVRVVVGRLFRLDRVQSYLSERRLASGLLQIVEPSKAPRVINGVPEEPTGREHSLSDSTLLAALNRIVTSYGSVVWMYSEKHCGEEREYNITVH